MGDVAITVLAKNGLRSVCKCYSAIFLCDPNNAHVYLDVHNYFDEHLPAI